MRRPRGAPSRSSQKLIEALVWLGHGPEAGDQCVDLGAAPGGWAQVLAERRCRVLAVDLGHLTLPPAVRSRVYHLRKNAFEFIPEESVDWVFCDMAYRPLEVAALLARWGRRHWARFLLANIKLPMRKRVEMLNRVREILATGGWTGLRARQLYHDRDEVTLFAWRGFGQESRSFRPPRRETRAGSARRQGE
jgi:23S rRNA (cytidine2498-2'-O)-methyltransferase